MLMSYIGGSPEIIKSDYRFGIRSLLRESLLVEAYHTKNSAELMMDITVIETQFAALLDPAKAQNILRNKMTRGRWLAQLQQMDLFAREPFLMGAESLINLYKALEKSGIMKNEIKEAEELAEAENHDA
jgi:hypothetical protein